MIIKVEFDDIRIVDGKALINLKNNKVIISKNSGVSGGLNVIEDIELDLISFLKSRFNSVSV